MGGRRMLSRIGSGGLARGWSLEYHCQYGTIMRERVGGRVLEKEL